MLLNYLKIGFRNLIKNKTYSFINIAGLAIAVSLGIIIALFIAGELQYDRHYATAGRVYRVHYEVQYGSNHHHMATTPAMAASALQNDFHEIESSARIVDYGSFLVKSPSGKESIKEQHVLYTDSSFFKVFPVRVLQGDPHQALTLRSSAAISQRTAEKYFGEDEALGKTLLLDNRYNATVTAIYEDFPQTSHFHPDILLSFAGDWSLGQLSTSTVFSNNDFNTYLLLKAGTDAKALEARLPAFLEKYAGKPTGTDFSRFTLMPLTDIHLHSALSGELEPNGSITYVYLFSSIGIFILLIACINFMNLSTALSVHRAKEVGVRKVMGSQRMPLIVQFMVESGVITVIAFVVALGTADVILPRFNEAFQTNLVLPLDSPSFYLTLTAAVFLVSLAAGAYPSFFLSAFKTVNVLKGKAVLGTRTVYFRSGLVVFQFVISIFLIVSAITVRDQVSFIQNKKLGFEKDHVLMVKDAYVLRPNVGAFKTEAGKITAVQGCTVSAFVPVKAGSEYPRRDRTFWKEGDTGNYVNIQQWSVDEDYVATYSMKMLDGRSFSAGFPADATGVILNKAAVDQFNLGDHPIGKRILTFTGNGEPDFEHPQAYTVIGVVDNFHYSSMKESIASLGLFLGRSDGFVSVRFAGDPKPVVASLEKIWKTMAPSDPFQYTFVDEEFGRMYAHELRLASMFGVFAVLAIVIACFGLFALTAYTARQRAKEIGIRKVLGASVASIMLLLTSEFNKLLVMAFVIAVPLSWYATQWWLTAFSYRIDMGISAYVLAGVVVAGISWLTTWHHTYRAACSDPVESIKAEG